VTSPCSDIRIHIQLDKRYQEFLKNAKEKEVLGYKMRVADIKDILKGKIWAYEDGARASLKREKDLLDIKRIIEKFPELINILSKKLKKKDLCDCSSFSIVFSILFILCSTSSLHNSISVIAVSTLVSPPTLFTEYRMRPQTLG